jgi:hypothetical protein
MMNLLRRRPGVPLELFYEYWSGGHTQISSRLPGIHQYFQHHLSYEEGAMWPTIEGVDRHLPEQDLFQGDAELTFVSQGDLDAFVAALEPLMHDEQNVFEETISYQALGGNARTYLDRIPEDSPNGDLHGVLKLMVYVQKATAASLEDFRHALREEVAPALASSPHVLKLRLRLVEPYRNDAVTLLAPNVSNRKDEEKQYQGCLELAFASPLELRRFVGSEAWRGSTDVLARVLRAAHAFRALRTYTVYNHGQITTAGLRTPQVAEQIRRLGATNQVGRQVLDLVLGEHVQRSVKEAG